MAGEDAGADTGIDKTAGEVADKTAETIVDVGAADKAADGVADKATADAGKTGDAGAGADWRAKLAGEDTAFKKTLERYADEGSFGKAHRALLAKMSSGEVKKVLAEGATPEEVATWRKENGIPDKPEGYLEKLSLPNGLVLGEEDKPIVTEFAAAALEDGVNPKQLSGLVAKYYAIQDAKAAKQIEDDAAFHDASQGALRADWEGIEFKRNLTAVQNMLSSWPEGLAARVLAGRTADGRKIGDDPVFLKQLANLARTVNPLATLVPAGTTDAGKSVADELEAINKLNRENPDAYNADKALQARELELIAATQAEKKRNVA